MKIAAVALALAGCAFTQDRPDDLGGGGGGGGGGQDGSRTACDPADPTLKLCLDFEEPFETSIADLSADGVIATAEQVLGIDHDDERAAMLSPGSRLRVPESAKLDITGALAIDAWIHPMMGLPIGPEKAWVLDNEKQYGIRLEDDKVVCLVKDRLVASPPLASPQDWHHIACTYDSQVMKVFVDGQLAACRAEATPIPTDGKAGLALGANLGGKWTFSEPYRGGLDNVRVWARADIDVCAAAGSTGCATVCP